MANEENEKKRGEAVDSSLIIQVKRVPSLFLPPSKFPNNSLSSLVMTLVNRALVISAPSLSRNKAPIAFYNEKINARNETRFQSLLFYTYFILFSHLKVILAL